MFIARRSLFDTAPLGAECHSEHMALLRSAAAFFVSVSINIMLLRSNDRFRSHEGPTIGICKSP